MIRGGERKKEICSDAANTIMAVGENWVQMIKFIKITEEDNEQGITSPAIHGLFWTLSPG